MWGTATAFLPHTLSAASTALPINQLCHQALFQTCDRLTNWDWTLLTPHKHHGKLAQQCRARRYISGSINQDAGLWL